MPRVRPGSTTSRSRPSSCECAPVRAAEPERTEDGRRAFLVRLLASLVLAAAVTLTLFWTMQYMILSGERPLEEAVRGHRLDFVRIERAEVIKRRQRKPEKPPLPQAPPPEPPPPRSDEIEPSVERIAVRSIPVEIAVDVSASGFSLTTGDGEYLPIVKVAPAYPRRALARGIEGWVIIEFTVTRLGTVRDPRVIDSEPKTGIFHQAALAAARRFKYKPRVIDGVAVEVPGVRNKITFRLER